MKKTVRIIKVIFNRNRGFVIINITGLAIGLAVSLMLLLFVATELSYDRHIENGQRIVQLNTGWTENGKREVMPICMRTAYTDLPAKVPGIEAAVQIYRGFQVELIREQERFPHVELLYSDPEYFRVFGATVIHGNLSTALRDPYTAVITEKTAMQVYGTTQVLDKTFSIGEQLFTVKAVVKDLPANTSFTFDVLASMNSVSNLQSLGGLEFFTFYLLKQGVDQTRVCGTINTEYASMLKEGFSQFNMDFSSLTLKLFDIYLHSPASYGLGRLGSMKSVLVLAALAFLILLLAVSNFVNLFLVQGDRRASEIGIRKTMGGTVKNIAIQFFTEATLIVLMAFVAGIFLAASFIKPFAAIIHKTIEPGLIFSPFFILGILVTLVFTIVLAASYPAFYLSRFRPSEAIKRVRHPSKRRFTATIAIFQSVITIVLISLIFVVNRQLDYLAGLPKGYDTTNVLIVAGVNERIASNYEALKQELKKHPEIMMVSAAHHVVGGGASGQGIRLLESSDQTIQSINEYRVMPGLSELMQFRLVEGKSFGENQSLDRNSIVINEAAAKMLGISGAATGRKVVMFEDPMEIIGVVSDFYYDTPAQAVQPMALTCYRTTPANIYIRFKSSLNKQVAMEMLLPLFRQYDPDFNLNPVWCDDVYDAKFEKERSLSEIVSVSTVLSLVIALIGLLAIHAYAAARRTKEIGLRKVLGSSSPAIVALLSREILMLVCVAGAVSIPVSFYIARTWLANYANHIGISWVLLLVPVFLQVLMTLAATGWISLRISMRNPVEALRYE